MSKYSFKWKEEGGSRGLQPGPHEAPQGRGESGTLVNTGKLVTESRNDSPEPLVHLLGCVNETRVVVEGVEMTALVYTGSQISALTEGFCNGWGLRIFPLRNLMKGVLHLKGTGGITIPYKG